MSATEVFRELLKKHQEIDLVRYDVQHNHAPMVLIALYLLFGVLVSNACTSFLSYLACLTAWPLVIIGLGLSERFAPTRRAIA